MPKIAGIVNFCGVGVPCSEEGRFLDWRHASDTEAPVLTSPYGPLHFLVGSADSRIILDYCEMPDGQILIDVAGDTDLVTLGHLYLLATKAEGLGIVWDLTERVVADLKVEGVEHDFEEYAADAWYFFRAVSKAVGKHPYCLMDDHQLRCEDSL